MSASIHSTIIKFNNVNFQLKNKLILTQFNLRIDRGQKVVIFGKSGLGKSTIARLILGFVKAQGGEIIINGLKLNKNSIWQVRKQIAYVDQDTSLDEGKVRQVIKEYLNFKVNTGLFQKQRLLDYLDKLELDRLILDQDTSELSGGERQRLAIIIALMLKRPILILDEATSALDPKLKQKVIELIKNQKEQTVISIAHDQAWQKEKSFQVFNLLTQTWMS